jgi:hypothetical protein
MSAARRLLCLLAACTAFLAAAGDAFPAGGHYVFAGGSPEARLQVRAALDRSAFDWDVVPGPITIRITDCGCAGSRPGEVVLDERLLTASPLGPRYAWGIVQHEYAHQLDFLVLDQADRYRLSRRFGARAWCTDVAGFRHDDYGCERFATLVAWAYWRSAANVQRPDWRPAAAPTLRRAAVRAFVARLLASS